MVLVWYAFRSSHGIDSAHLPTPFLYFDFGRGAVFLLETSIIGKVIIVSTDGPLRRGGFELATMEECRVEAEKNLASSYYLTEQVAINASAEERNPGWLANATVGSAVASGILESSDMGAGAAGAEV